MHKNNSTPIYNTIHLLQLILLAGLSWAKNESERHDECWFNCQMCVRASDKRVSARTCLSSVTLKPRSVLYNDLTDEVCLLYRSFQSGNFTFAKRQQYLSIFGCQITNCSVALLVKFIS